MRRREKPRQSAAVLTGRSAPDDDDAPSRHRPPRHPEFGIDIVRGISIMLVAIHHTALRILLAKTALVSMLPGPLLVALSWDGYEAVFAFFVVSGILITGYAIQR